MRKLMPALVTLVCLLPTTALANAIIGVTWAGDVVRIDSVTGSGSAIAPTGYFGLNSLTRDSSGALLTIGWDGALSEPVFLAINPQTGQATKGAITRENYSLATSPAGVLYGTSRIDPLDIDSIGLFTFDEPSGNASVVGALGARITGLEFSPTGILYGWDVFFGLFTVNPTTGAATDVNAAVNAGVEIQSLAFSPDGVLYGARDALYTIDLVTGVPMLVGSGGYADVRGIAFVPEPGALLLLGSALAALWARRRSWLSRD